MQHYSYYNFEKYSIAIGSGHHNLQTRNVISCDSDSSPSLTESFLIISCYTRNNFVTSHSENIFSLHRVCKGDRITPNYMFQKQYRRVISVVFQVKVKDEEDSTQAANSIM